MTRNETLFASAIKYVRPFDPEKLKTYVWKQRSNNNEHINASAPCLTGTSVEELFYCEDHFRCNGKTGENRRRVNCTMKKPTT